MAGFDRGAFDNAAFARQYNALLDRVAALEVLAHLGSPAPLVTAFPDNPVDGQEIDYLADATSGVVWRLKYRAASSSAYKWEFVGGSDLRDFVSAQQSRTINSYGDLTTIGPSVTVPLAGDYDVQVGGGLQAPAGTGSIAVASMSFATGATAASDSDSAYLVNFNSGAGEGKEASASGPVARKTGVAASALIRAKYKSAAGSAFFKNRWLIVRPVRVG